MVKVTNRLVEETAGHIVLSALGLFAHREGIREAGISALLGASEGRAQKIQLRLQVLPIKKDVREVLRSVRERVDATLSSTPTLDIFVPVGSGDPAAREYLEACLTGVTVTAGQAEYQSGVVALELIFEPKAGQTQ